MKKSFETHPSVVVSQWSITWHTWQDVEAWLHEVGYLLHLFVAVRELDDDFTYVPHIIQVKRYIHSDYRRLCVFHAWPWNWRSHPTWLSLSQLIFVQSRWFFCCFVKILGEWIHSNYCYLCDSYVNSCRPWRYLQFSRSHVKITQLANGNS